MLRLDDNKYFSKPFLYGTWFLMAFQAGYVNVGGFFTSGSFVSHVTGTSSNIGMGIAKVDMVMLATFLTVLLAFITGASFAGHFIGRPKEDGKEPQYTFVLLIKCAFFGGILALSTMAEINYLGLTQERINLLIIFMLSFCCGVQNATCSLATGGFLKPTHMTGLSTDVGAFMTRLWSKKKDPTGARNHYLRIGILTSFIFGGVVSTMIFSHNGHYGFLFPFISSVCFLMMGFARSAKKEGISYWGFKTARGSIIATFLVTLYFGIDAYLKIS